MSRRRKSSDTTPFDSMKLEGSLFVPELLERAASGAATFQKETDYAIPKGLKLHDEYGRAFRIATASWKDFAPQMARTDHDAAKSTRAFVTDLLRQCLGYTDLAALKEPITLDDRAFPITAMACGGRLPVIIAPHNLGLDDPDPHFAIIGSGSRKKSAHQLAQEFLNASPECLWAIVTNGKTLRLLRDAETLTRPNFLEFDLETILREAEDRYADFSALWRILHSSRCSGGVSPSQDSQIPIWEQWKSEGHAQGLRVRDGLRDGVTQALLILGSGFLKQTDNDALRQRLHDGSLTTDAYFQQLLRLIYRCLFLFCAEERDLLHPPTNQQSEINNPQSEINSLKARAAYATGYSLRRFRKRSLRQSAHDPHGDLWIATKIVFRALSGGQEKLALPALGGLFAETQCPDLDSASLTNRDLLAAMRELRWFFDKKSGKRSAIDYRNMGPEELGSVYESLLELVPQLDLPARAFGFAGITDAGSTSGNARKTTGSYYTPDSLVQELIKSALDPVIAAKLAAQPDRPIAALLSITVCDPSCGSGHFLLAAARRLAEKLAELRAPDGAVRPDDYRHALREVASRCLFGVDINPMAVELCRVALWLETVDPGKPLGFLDHHIRSGNSLLGTTPDLIAAGLPDDTFKAIEGDDKKACTELKKRNKKEREGFGPLFEKEEQALKEKLRQAASAIEEMDDSRPDLLHQKEAAFLTSESSPEHHHAQLLADLWCAAFVINKTFSSPDDSQISNLQSQIAPSPEEGQLLHSNDDLFGQPVPAAKTIAKPKSPPITDHSSLGTLTGITTATLRDYVQSSKLPADLESEVAALTTQYNFFHWHLAFPQVFAHGGFDCILGNPPWERVKIQEKEWFSSHGREDIANAATSAVRQRLIENLRIDQPSVYWAFQEDLRKADGESHLIRNSGKYPLCGRGDVNTYTIFTELNRSSVCGGGRVGCIVPTGIATDDTTKFFFSDLVSSHSLVSLFDIENRNQVFPGVHRSFRFSLLTLRSKGDDSDAAVFAFFLGDASDLRDPARSFALSAAELALLNPNTHTCPIFANRADAELAKAIYRRVPVLILEDSDGRPEQTTWGVSFRTMFHMANDSQLFRSNEQLNGEGYTLQGNLFQRDRSTFLPLYEAKMTNPYDHRHGSVVGNSDLSKLSGIAALGTTLDQHQDPNFQVLPRYWVNQSNVASTVERLKLHFRFLIVFRDVARATDVRTAILSVLPVTAVGHKAPLILPMAANAVEACAFLAGQNSFAYDYFVRQKFGSASLSYFVIKQTPFPPLKWFQNSPIGLTIQWFQARVLELTYTAWDLEAFAQDCGWPGPPFRWDEDRRFLLRCELDAAFFHLYLGTDVEWQRQPEALTRAFPTPRHAVSYIMDTFPIVKRKDIAKHGTYRTQETILQIYDALAESIASGVAYQTRLSPVPTDPRIAHMPKLPDIPRTVFAAEDYFEVVLPLVLSMAPEGLERARLFHAIELLADPAKRTKAARNLGDIGTQWAQAFRETYSFADAGKALITEVTKGRIRGVERMHIDPQAAVTTSNPWLCVDAFLALRLALEAEVSTVQTNEKTQQTLVEQIIRIAQVA
jgi:hypothetical protein